ncbi:MAG: flagellar hook-associated protein FlgL [Sphingomonas sp.]
MQISTSLFYDTTTSLMQKLSQHADALNTQISTGKRLAQPSDDVVAYRRLAAIAQANGYGTAYSGNIKLAQSLLQQSDSVLGSVDTQLQRAKELTIQASTGTLNDADRKAIATELRSIRDDLAGLANTQDARGQPLFAAADGNTAVIQAADGSVSFAGTGTPAAIPVADNVSVQPTESAARVFGGVPSGASTTDVFALLGTFADALDAGGDISTAAKVANDGVAAASTQVAAVRGSLGARATRLDLEATRNTDAAAARETDRSSLEDTDVTAAITELQKTMTTLQATQASFTKLSSLSLFDYLK